jgi:hypothetical protein
MWFAGLKTQKAAEVGRSLADPLVKSLAAGNRKKGRALDGLLQAFLTRVDTEVVPMRLGMFRRAKLANTFKWHLLENGFEPALVDELTRMLLVRLSMKPAAPPDSRSRS